MRSAAGEPVVEKELLLGRNKAAERPAPQALPSSASSSPLPAESALPAVAEASAEQGGIPFTVDSMFRGGKIPCYAFLPADRKPGERFPVVYLLHGAFEDAGVWNTRAGALLSKLATRERLVFIAPSCGRTGWYADSPYLKKSRIESFFARELMPYVERAFPVLPKRGVMGMSMGGARFLCPCATASRLLCLGQLHERRYGHYPASRSMEDPRRARPYERQQGVVAVVFRRRSAETVEGRRDARHAHHHRAAGRVCRA